MRDNYFQISNFGELQQFRDLVNDGGITGFSGGELTSDIIFNEQASRLYDEPDWIPIGNSKDNGYYNLDGFYGNGHIIRGLKSGYGLFYRLKGQMTIAELGLEDCYINPNNVVGAGALAAHCSMADYGDILIARCYADGIIDGGTPGTVGGLVGEGDLADFCDCYSTVEITGYYGSSGGIVGVAGCDEGSIVRCVVNADLWGDTLPILGYWDIEGQSGPFYGCVYNSERVKSDSHNYPEFYFSQGIARFPSRMLRDRSRYSFDFDNVWYMDYESGMPKLRCFLKDGRLQIHDRFDSCLRSRL